MALRVSTGQYVSTFISQMNDNRARLEDVRNQISSGLRVAKPSDDAGKTGTIINMQSLLQRIESHQRRTGLAINSLDVQENTVTSANEVMIRIQELATQAANETYTPAVRRQMAEEVYQLRDQLVALANTKHQGTYLYGGYNDTAPPFTLDSTFYPTPTDFPVARSHYQLATGPGQDLTRLVQISDTDSLRINTVARTVFLDAINATEVLGRALAGARTDLIDADGDGAVDDPDPAGTHLAWDLPDELNIQSAAIRDALNMLRSARSNNIETELSSIGARMNRIDQTREILVGLRLNTESSRSSLQDADIFEVSTNFANLQNSFEALLSSGSRINSLSLLDFI